MLGGLQIYALHKEIVDSGKMSNRAFHDAILKENRIPIDMIRAAREPWSPSRARALRALEGSTPVVIHSV